MEQDRNSMLVKHGQEEEMRLRDKAEKNEKKVRCPKFKEQASIKHKEEPQCMEQEQNFKADPKT